MDYDHRSSRKNISTRTAVGIIITMLTISSFSTILYTFYAIGRLFIFIPIWIIYFIISILVFEMFVKMNKTIPTKLTSGTFTRSSEQKKDEVPENIDLEDNEYTLDNPQEEDHPSSVLVEIEDHTKTKKKYGKTKFLLFSIWLCLGIVFVGLQTSFCLMDSCLSTIQTDRNRVIQNTKHINGTLLKDVIIDADMSYSFLKSRVNCYWSDNNINQKDKDRGIADVNDQNINIHQNGEITTKNEDTDITISSGNLNDESAIECSDRKITSEQMYIFLSENTRCLASKKFPVDPISCSHLSKATSCLERSGLAFVSIPVFLLCVFVSAFFITSDSVIVISITNPTANLFLNQFEPNGNNEESDDEEEDEKVSEDVLKTNETNSNIEPDQNHHNQEPEDETDKFDKFVHETEQNHQSNENQEIESSNSEHVVFVEPNQIKVDNRNGYPNNTFPDDKIDFD